MTSVMKASSRCELDGDGYTPLSSILVTYNAAISEDHAWALCYQSMKFVNSLPLNYPVLFSSSPQLSDLDLIKIHQSGYVALSLGPVNGDNFSGEDSYVEAVGTAHLTSKIAVIIYKALDFGITEEEERSLSHELEHLLDRMVSGNEAHNSLNPESILNACIHRLQHSESADTFYQLICRNLVIDALTLTKFIDIAAEASRQLNMIQNRRPIKSEDGLLGNKDNFKGMAKMWIQVVRELRRGVKLRKLEDCDSIREPRDFQKTPYEQLMEDIRSQRTHLRATPDVRKMSPRPQDIHGVIMDYVRSRPALRRTSERVLAPPQPRKRDPVEVLMESIRQTHKLRPVQRHLNGCNVKESSR